MVNKLKALSDDTRFSILALLLSHSPCVRSIAEELSISESAVSQHLKVLREAGLIYGEKRGYYMHYQVDKNQIRKLAKNLLEMANTLPVACKKSDTQCEETITPCSKAGTCDEETIAFCHGPQEQTICP